MSETVVRRARPGEARAWVEHLLKRVEAGEDLGDDCLLWPFSTNRGSGGHYPQIVIDGKNQRVSRVIFERLAERPLAAGEVIRHSCDVMRCCHPFHFSTGTQLDNIADQVKRNRQAAGERNGQARLTADNVRDIRALARDHDLRGSVSFIARSFGVTARAVTLVLRGETWTGIEPA